MPTFSITNPIINSPFLVPSHHYSFDKDGFPTGIAEGRRASSYWIPVPPPRKTVKQMTIVDNLEETREENTTINPTKSKNEPIVGESVMMTLADLEKKRMAEVEFLIAQTVAARYAPPDPNADPAAAIGPFPQILGIVRQWIAECVTLKDHVFPQLLWLSEYRHSAAEKIHRAIRPQSGGEPKVRAVLQDEDPFGTTAIVNFDTLKRRYLTNPAKCHVNFVPYDSEWEAHFAQTLEDEDELPEVRAYVKNQNLGFRIRYTHEGRPGNYYPDYIVLIDDGRGPGDLLHLVVEISGQDREDKQTKVDTARKVWVPAVNALGTAGRWDYLEIRDPLSAIRELKGFLRSRANDSFC